MFSDQDIWWDLCSKTKKTFSFAVSVFNSHGDFYFLLNDIWCFVLFLPWRSSWNECGLLIIHGVLPHNSVHRCIPPCAHTLSHERWEQLLNCYRGVIGKEIIQRTQETLVGTEDRKCQVQVIACFMTNWTLFSKYKFKQKDWHESEGRCHIAQKSVFGDSMPAKILVKATRHLKLIVSLILISIFYVF